jgi:hypothetical protein
MIRSLFALFTAAVCTATATAAPAKTRTFIGTFEVPEGRRDEVIRALKGKNFLGAFVPDGAGPHTLLYRGLKAEYEAALEAVNRHLHPEWYDGGRPRGFTPAPAKSAPGGSPGPA